MTRFEFATAGRVVFGIGARRELPAAVRDAGSRALLVTGRSSARAAAAEQLLRAGGVAVTTCPIAREPTIDDVMRGVADARAAGCDVVVGFGGGAALDAAKAIAALLANGGDPLDYLEVIGRGQPLARPSVPWFAVPTTAGTGTEVTRNAVLTAPAQRVKVSLRSPHMLARGALVDPELTLDLPPALTAATGLDALTQLIEPYVSCRANPITDALCVEGIRRAACSLRRAVEHGGDIAAREDMALASLFGGFALANAGLGAVHGFAGPVGGMFPAPHGAICAALLPHVMAANLAALRRRAPQHPALDRYDEIARLLTGKVHANGSDGVQWVRELVAALAIPTLQHHGLAASDFPALVEASARASSMKANPLPLTADELHAILAAAW